MSMLRDEEQGPGGHELVESIKIARSLFMYRILAA